MNYVLRLYTMAETPNSTRALKNIKHLCKEHLSECYELEVIDILKHPQLAEDDKIIAIPTLFKMMPRPIRRLVGDLSNQEKVLVALDIFPQNDIVHVSGREEASPKTCDSEQKDSLQLEEARS